MAKMMRFWEKRAQNRGARKSQRAREKQEWAAFVVTSSEGKRTAIAPEDWDDYKAQREAIWTRLNALDPNLMYCDVCDEPFLEGEAMRPIPGIGDMHQDCKPAPDSFFGRIRAAVEEDENDGEYE